MGLLRLFLALGVAAGHAWGNFGLAGEPIFIGGRAVQIFYMISGFLIAMILDGKYANSPRGVWLFYSNRALKIFVPYLVVLAVTVAASLLLYAAAGNAGPMGAIVGEARAMKPLT
jgi:peptidoglycan/LPS O-acetylase OafA/YrhL